VSPVPPPVIATVPFAPSVLPMICFGPPSVSVSLASGSGTIAFGPESSLTVALSSTATGASSRHVTSTVTVAKEPPLIV
jgi:hypothetical protein